jgi:hypothetical protein
MQMRSLLACAMVIVVTLLAGCGNTPLAKPGADTLAKLMKPVPDKAVIYVFRNEPDSAPWPIRVTLDGKDMGESRANTYFRWTVDPGEHMILSYTENVAGLLINTEPGRIYYVWQETKMGFFQPRSELKRMDRTTAEIALQSCYLLEGKS